jgi:acid phosphatase
LKDDNPTTQIDSPIITSQLGTKWKSYQESLPAPGWMGMLAPNTAGDYEAQHNPFRYFTDVSQNARQRNLMVPLTELAKDLQTTATTPEYAEITPNLCNDMHDDCGGRVNRFDQWLNAQTAIIFNSPAWKTQNCLLEIQIDEGDPNYGKGQYMTMYVGPSVMKGGHTTAPYTHESSLEVAERALGLKPFTDSDRNAPIPHELFKPQSPINQGGLNTTPNSQRITPFDPTTPAPPTPSEGLS